MRGLKLKEDEGGSSSEKNNSGSQTRATVEITSKSYNSSTYDKKNKFAKRMAKHMNNKEEQCDKQHISKEIRIQKQVKSYRKMTEDCNDQYVYRQTCVTPSYQTTQLSGLSQLKNDQEAQYQQIPAPIALGRNSFDQNETEQNKNNNEDG